MDRIKRLTQAIRDHAECDLDYGTLKTLKMIDEEAERIASMLKDREGGENER